MATIDIFRKFFDKGGHQKNLVPSYLNPTSYGGPRPYYGHSGGTGKFNWASKFKPWLHNSKSPNYSPVSTGIQVSNTHFVPSNGVSVMSNNFIPSGTGVGVNGNNVIPIASSGSGVGIMGNNFIPSGSGVGVGVISANPVNKVPSTSYGPPNYFPQSSYDVGLHTIETPPPLSPPLPPSLTQTRIYQDNRLDSGYIAYYTLPVINPIPLKPQVVYGTPAEPKEETRVNIVKADMIELMKPETKCD